MSALVRELTQRHGLPSLDATSIDAFLAPAPGAPAHALLFFAGLAQNRPETADVAVILPELLRAFAGRLRGAVIAPQAEAALRERFQVHAFPALAMTRRADLIGVLSKVYDWADYVARIGGWLAPDAPALAPLPPSAPRVEIVHSRTARA